MSTKRILLIILIVVTLMPAARLSAAQTLPLEPNTDGFGYAPIGPSAPMAPPMGGEFEISNAGTPSAVAYNSIHDEYLVVGSLGGLCIGGVCSVDIYAQRVSSRGDLLGSEFAIAALVEGGASAAYDPVNNRYLVVWQDGKDIFGRFIPWEGVDPSLTAFTICNWASEQYAPSVVYAQDQQEFLVVWENDVSGVPVYISGRRVTAANGGFPAGGFTIASHTSQPRRNPSVAYNLARNEYLVTYDNDADIYGTRLRGDGTIEGGGEFGIAQWSDAEVYPAIAACHIYDQYLVMWQSRQASSDKFYTRFINGDGSLGGVHLIGDYQDVAWYAGIGFDVTCRWGLQYLVSWERYDTTTGQTSIWGRLVYPDETLDPDFEIAPQGNISVGDSASGLLNDLVTWSVRTGMFSQTTRGRIIGESDPKAVFTVSPSGGTTSTVFNFDASGSYDAQDPASGLQVRWDWENDGVYDTSWSTTKTTSHTFASIGTYDVRLEVQDTYGLSDTTTRQVTVWDPSILNVVPDAAFTINPPNGDTSTIFTFDASGCSDLEDPLSALEVRWDWNNDGIFETGWDLNKIDTHIFETAGVHTVRLEVLDTGGLTNATTQQVTVTFAPPPPAGMQVFLPLVQR